MSSISVCFRPCLDISSRRATTGFKTRNKIPIIRRKKTRPVFEPAACLDGLMEKRLTRWELEIKPLTGASRTETGSNRWELEALLIDQTHAAIGEADGERVGLVDG